MRRFLIDCYHDIGRRQPRGTVLTVDAVSEEQAIKNTLEKGYFNLKVIGEKPYYKISNTPITYKVGVDYGGKIYNGKKNGLHTWICNKPGCNCTGSW